LGKLSSEIWRRFARRARGLELVICVSQLATPIVSLRAEIIDRVLAIVAGQMIMLSDVTAARELGLVTPAELEKIESSADPTGAMLSRLIDRALMLAQVDRYAPPEPSAEAVERDVQNVRARLASPADFASALLRSGIDEQRLRQMLREDLRIRSYEDERFTVPAPGDAELGRYYRDHPQMFARGDQRLSLDEARPEIVRALVREQQDALIANWVAGLRRRAEIIDLYSPAR
jgi:hypothetical protein